MYTNLVILIMRLQSTHALAWLSAGRERVVTWDGKMEPLPHKENIYLLFFLKQQTADKQPIRLWITATAKFPLISEASPNNKQQEKGNS